MNPFSSIISSMLLSFSSQLLAVDYQPKSDDEVLWIVPDGLKVYPEQYAGQTTLDATTAEPAIADLLSAARASGDPRLYGQAQAVLLPWWKDAGLQGPLLLHRANIKQFNHQFEAAIQDLRRFLKESPQSLEGQLMLVSILQVQGKFSDAESGCKSLASINQLIQTICSAGNLALIGRTGEAITMLQPLESFLRLRSKGLLPYYWSTLADAHARSGNFNDAAKFYQAALDLAPDDRFTLAAIADVWSELKMFERIIETLRAHVQHDSLLIRFAMAQKKIGAEGLPSSIVDLQERFSREQQRGASRHDREAALFRMHVLDSPTEALRLATSNWEIQRETIDVRVYIDAALAVNSRDDLEKIAQWMRNSGYRDAYCNGVLKNAGIEI